MHKFAKFFLYKILKWKILGDSKLPKKCVIIVGPHTHWQDFIYAIIIEEFGLIGGLFLVILYLWFLFRIVIISNKSESVFGSLLAVSMGLPIVFQAFINMSVAVELMPVTGQTLPLISSGGTSIWMTCLSIGIILSVSRKYESKNEEIDNTNPLEILKETI